MDLRDILEDIDLVDYRILKLLNDRMELALMAKKLKSEEKESEREREFLNRIRRRSTGLINAELIEKIYLEIVKESQDLRQKDCNLIAFQGEHGAYGEVASKAWNYTLVTVACREFAGIFEGVKTGLYDFGIVPVENTLGGVVGQVNRLLINTDLHVIGAVELSINHCLIVQPGTDHREIRAVYSDALALAQCRNFLSRNKLEPVQYYDSSGAAKMLAEQRPRASAVIASKLSAELYNLEILKEDIDDLDTNTTRFLVLSREDNTELGDKCSLVFSTEHKAGTLFRVLEVFARESINLTRIESVPNEFGSYVFFLDFMGSKKEENVVKALQEVEEISTDLRLMGCYKEKKVV
jgi:prephenate dehydratase/chorismate mutase/prephenate dehydratase